MFFRKSQQNTIANTLDSVQEISYSRGLEINAIKKNTACIVFSTDGYILEVNNLFLSTMGYRQEEVIGRHHMLFCSEEFIKSADYKIFWADLKMGHSFKGTFERVKNNGDVVILEANYFPVVTDSGAVTKIIKIASDVTKTHASLAQKEALLESLDKSLAVIEFSTDGTILNANENFLKVMCYNFGNF
jgi:methyl-accepting chemotaxis protein